MLSDADFDELFPETFRTSTPGTPRSTGTPPRQSDGGLAASAQPDPMRAGLAMTAPAVDAAWQMLSALVHAPAPLHEVAEPRVRLRRPTAQRSAPDTTPAAERTAETEKA